MNDQLPIVESAFKPSIPARAEKACRLDGSGPAFVGLMTANKAKKALDLHQWPFYVYALCTHSMLAAEGFPV